MKCLLPYLYIYIQRTKSFVFGILIIVVVLLSSILQTAISIWFITQSAIYGIIKDNFNYIIPAIIVRFITIIRTIGKWIEKIINHNITLCILQDLRTYVFSIILPISSRIITNFYHSDILNSLISDIDTLNYFYLRIISPLLSLIITIFLVIIIYYIFFPNFWLITLSVLLSVMIIFMPIIYIISKSIGCKITNVRAQYRFQINSWIYGNPDIILYCASKKFLRKLQKIEKYWTKLLFLQKNIYSIIQSLLLLISGIILIIFLVYILRNTDMVFPSKFFILPLVFTIINIIEIESAVINSIQYIGQVISSANRLNDIKNSASEELLYKSDSEYLNNKDISVSINNLCFSYPIGKIKIINNLSLIVPAGQHIAIFGHTGSGKSTLLRLLTRIYNPTYGFIKINNIPLYRWSEENLRFNMSIVPQKVHIFNATLRENLKIASKESKDEDLIRILKQVGLYKLLLNDGLDTFIGEGGVVLSGGEIKCLGIARALLHSSSLLLLDEPTEGLDNIYERKILNLLTNFYYKKTLIIITNRIQYREYLKKLDQIYIMDSGSFIENGTYKDLIKNKGHYYNYYY